MGEPVVVQVQRYLSERMALGVRRYGRPLQAHNGRDWLIDAFEEAVDLTVYLAQGLIERDGRLPDDESPAGGIEGATCTTGDHGDVPAVGDALSEEPDERRYPYCEECLTMLGRDYDVRRWGEPPTVSPKLSSDDSPSDLTQGSVGARIRREGEEARGVLLDQMAAERRAPRGESQREVPPVSDRSKRNMKPFDPDWVVAPGETLAEWARDRGLTAHQAAQRFDLGVMDYLSLLVGELELTDDVADRIATGTGTPKRFWLNMERNFREGLAAGKAYTPSVDDGGDAHG